VGRVSEWPARLAERARPIVALGYLPAAAAGLLGTLAAAETLVTAPQEVTAAGGTYNGGVQAALLLVGLLTTLPLGLLWARPALAALTVTAAVLVSLVPFHALTIAGVIAQLAVLYRLGRRGSPQLLAAALAMTFLMLRLAMTPKSPEIRVLTLMLAGLAPAAAWAGIAARARGDAAKQRAASSVIAGALLEHTARGERARISRELHDVVAHHISMIAVQAETARLATPGMPAAGAQRLSAIGDTARAALTEMRRLLGVLREDSQADVADRRPQPGLRQLNELLDEAREAADSSARLIVRGTIAALDEGVELAAYRIVQEALTNSRRHAPGAAVDVELHYAGDTLRLRIRDNGPGPPAELASGGHGLLGMRERAAAVGGRLRTGTAPGGGFLVEATLPTADAVRQTPLSHARAQAR
jgi:signal transduction histidine kinase